MKNKKYTNAGLRVLETLKVLTKQPLSPDEMLRYLESTTNNFYRKELILKYLNTFRLLNINIEKINGKYFIKKNPDPVHLDKNDLAIMLFIKNYINNIGYESFKNNIFESLEIIERSFSGETDRLAKTLNIKPYKPKKNPDIKDKNIIKFEKYCNDKLRIQIKYKNYDSNEVISYKLSPLNVIYKKGKAVLIAYDNKDNDYKEFILENIVAVSQSPQKQQKASPSSVLFKLYGRLAHSYMLKKNETVIESGDDYIIISNNSEDRELLIRRLLRYFDKCEILYPKSCRKRLLEIVNEMEAIYA